MSPTATLEDTDVRVVTMPEGSYQLRHDEAGQWHIRRPGERDWLGNYPSRFSASIAIAERNFPL